jgi:hypothetical protein
MDKINGYFPSIDNPEHIWKQDEALYGTLEPIINELLDELKAKGKISLFPSYEAERMKKIMENVYQLEINNNWFIKMEFDDKLLKKNFLAMSAEYGINELMFTYLYLQSCVLSGIAHTEMFKTFLLYHLNVNCKVSEFYHIMENNAPHAWMKLKPYFDSTLRNALAHGTWIIENGDIVLFKDVHLIKSESMPLKTFFLEVKRLNVLYIVLFEVIKKKQLEGFFDISSIRNRR